jgi:hypothetical protein
MVSNMFRGTKQPIKNFRLVVKNIVREAVSPTPMLAKFDLSNIQGELSTQVASKLYDVLEIKLRSKEYNNLDLWSNLIGYGINPVDGVLAVLSSRSIWRTGREQLVPELLCQTSPHPTKLPFDVNTVMSYVVEADSVYERLLALKPVIYEKEDSLGFVGAKARLFAVLATTDNVLVHAAFSPLIRSCFDAWVDELKEMHDEFKLACAGYILNRFERLTGSSANRLCHIDLYEPCHAFFFHAIEKISELRLHPETENAFGIRGVEHLKYIFDYLRMGLSERSNAARAIALCGNPQLTAGLMISLIRHPEEYAMTLRSFDASNDMAQELLRRNLHDDVHANVTHFIDIPVAESLVERFREAFKAQGYDDLVGSKGLDGLVVSLDLGEHFEKKGYLRREGMGLTSTFASKVSWAGVPFIQASPEGKAFGVDIIHRKIDLAVKLGQQQLLIDNFDKYFKGYHVPNTGLANNEALKYVLESGGLLPSDILTTPLRVKKAHDAGASAKVILKGVKLTNRVKGEYLIDALEL